jgi:parvulin-like peptidyl-prolyl cis-trans isomerase-like protein
MKKLLREPFLHFLLLAAVVFLIYKWRSKEEPTGPKEILVTQGTIENLTATYARVWNRVPTQEDVNRLIQEYVREEVCTRQAIAIGLDRDDTIIRRRLRQKMEFLFQNAVAQPEPSDAELLSYLKSHPESFRAEPMVMFTHVYLNPDRHSHNLAHEESRMRIQLEHATDAQVSELGDPFMLPHHFENATAREISDLFGKEFEAQISPLPIGQWIGPIQSGYGLHFVRIAAKTDGRNPSLKEVREDVRREWLNAKQNEAKKKFYDELLAGYTVRIEAPQARANQSKVAQVR